MDCVRLDRLRRQPERQHHQRSAPHQGAADPVDHPPGPHCRNQRRAVPRERDALAPTFRTMAGLRADRYRFDVLNSLVANTGSSSAGIGSPSLNLLFGPWALTEFYVNIGTGFHSNDARGTVTTIDPKSGDVLTPVPGLVRSKGMELGLRTEIIPKMQTSLSLYKLDFDSELTYVGDEGTTKAGRPSRR